MTVHDIITKLKNLGEMVEWDIPLNYVNDIIADVQILEAEREAAIREKVKLQKKMSAMRKGEKDER